MVLFCFSLVIPLISINGIPRKKSKEIIFDIIQENEILCGFRKLFLKFKKNSSFFLKA